MEEHIARLIMGNGAALPLLKLLEAIPANIWDPEKELMAVDRKKVRLLEYIFSNMRHGEEFFLDFLTDKKELMSKEIVLSAIEFGMIQTIPLGYGNIKDSKRINGSVWLNFAKKYLRNQGVPKREIADKCLELAIKMDSPELVETAIKDGGQAGKSIANIKSTKVLNLLIANGESLNAEKDKRKKSAAEIILSRDNMFFKDTQNCKEIRKHVMKSQIEAGEENQKKLILGLIKGAKVEDVANCLKQLSKDAWSWRFEDDENILFKIIASRIIWDEAFFEEIKEIPRDLWAQKNKFNKSPLDQIYNNSNGFEYLSAGAWVEIIKSVNIKKELVPLFMDSNNALKTKYPLDRCKGNVLFKQWNQELFEGISQGNCKILLNSIWKNNSSLTDRNLESREWLEGLKNIGEDEVKRLNLSGLKFGLEIGIELENFRRSCGTSMLLGSNERNFTVELEKVISKKISKEKDGESVLSYFSDSILTFGDQYESKHWQEAQRMIEGYLLKIGAEKCGVDMKRKNKHMGAL